MLEEALRNVCRIRGEDRGSRGFYVQFGKCFLAEPLFFIAVLKEMLARLDGRTAFGVHTPCFRVLWRLPPDGKMQVTIVHVFFRRVLFDYCRGSTGTVH